MKRRRLVYILVSLALLFVLSYFIFTGCHLSEVPEVDI